MKSNERTFDTTARYNSIDRTEVERAAPYIYTVGNLDNCR